jgi:molybdate transport system permease protein
MNASIDWQSIFLTIQLALITACLLTILGLPLAWWLAGTRSRWRVPLEAVLALPLVLPPTVLGFYVLLMLGSTGPLGKLHEKLTGQILAFSFEGLVIASFLYSLPFAVQPFIVAIRRVDAKWIEASWCLGESRLMTFRRVILPLAWPGILSGFVMSFAHTMGEFGVALMVGGNIAGVTRTVSISIYDSVQAMDYATAGWTSAMLLGASFGVLCVVYWLQGNFNASWLTKK